MKIGLRTVVTQRPAADAASRLEYDGWPKKWILGHCRSWQFHLDRKTLQTCAASADVCRSSTPCLLHPRRLVDRQWPHTAARRIKGVGRPITGRREIELAIRPTCCSRCERCGCRKQLTTGVTPKFIPALRNGRAQRRHNEIIDRLDVINDVQSLWLHDQLHGDAPPCRGCGMGNELKPHARRPAITGTCQTP